MEMTTHEIDVGLTSLDPNSFEVGTKGSYGLYQLHLTFSDDWDGFTKKISFYPAKRAAPVVVVISDDDYYIDVPAEATANAGICNFVVSGVMTGKAAITLPGTLTVEETMVPATTPAGSPTPSEIAQIYLAILGSERLPIPDESGYWKLYDYTAEEYVVSEYSTRGTQGIQGIQGVQGIQGTVGQRGSRLTTGTSITGTTPTGVVFASSGITDALIGDIYINTATNNVYQCLLGGIASIAKWGYVCNIKGATGKGISTIARTSGNGSAGATDTYTITYTDNATTTFTVVNGSNGTDGTDGTDGTRGSRISQGTAITGTAVESTVFALSGVTGSLVGDIYINTSTYNYYTCMLAGDPETATWSYSGCIKGADGDGSGDMLKSVYDPDANGIISADIIADGTTNKAYTATEKTKLFGIAESANNYVHPTTAGNKHVPSGGSANEVLKYSSDGTAVWGTDADTIYTHPTTDGNKHIPSGGASNQLLAYSSAGTAQWVNPAVQGLAYIGSCSTASGTAAKTSTISGFGASQLVTGVIIGVTFANANTSTTATLNISSTGAKNITANGASPVSGQIAAGMLALFQYDGTSWVHLNPVSVERLALAGGTMTGDVIGHADTDYTTARFRNVTLSTSDASGGSSGDVWIKYTA